MGAHPSGITLLHRWVDGPTSLCEVIDMELLIEIADTPQRSVIEAHGLGDSPMTVALHRDSGVDLDLTARGEEQHDRHCSRDTEQTGEGTGHDRDATSAHSRRIDDISHDPAQKQCH
jgi:hypothetical protein